LQESIEEMGDSILKMVSEKANVLLSVKPWAAKLEGIT